MEGIVMRTISNNYKGMTLGKGLGAFIQGFVRGPSSVIGVSHFTATLIETAILELVDITAQKLSGNADNEFSSGLRLADEMHLTRRAIMSKASMELKTPTAILDEL